MSSSCSFRITRTAEDLAQTLNSLSQRLVKLEQRLDAIELEQSQQGDIEIPIEETRMLDGVDQILKECQELLEISNDNHVDDESWPSNIEEDMAA